MQYCNECHSVEQGTITKEEPCHCGGMRELCCLCNSSGVIEFEICSICESEDDTMRHYDEDAGKER